MLRLITSLKSMKIINYKNLTEMQKFHFGGKKKGSGSDTDNKNKKQSKSDPKKINSIGSSDSEKRNISDSDKRNISDSEGKKKIPLDQSFFNFAIKKKETKDNNESKPFIAKRHDEINSEILKNKPSNNANVNTKNIIENSILNNKSASEIDIRSIPSKQLNINLEKKSENKTIGNEEINIVETIRESKSDSKQNKTAMETEQKLNINLEKKSENKTIGNEEINVVETIRDTNSDSKDNETVSSLNNNKDEIQKIDLEYPNIKSTINGEDLKENFKVDTNIDSGIISGDGGDKKDDGNKFNNDTKSLDGIKIIETVEGHKVI